MNTYRCILTTVGLNKQAAAIAANQPLVLTQIAVGDSNGLDVDISPSMTSLVHEVRRAQVSRMFVPVAGQVTIEQVLNVDVGGWWIRELGIYDQAGDLIAVAKVPPSFKPAPGSGAARMMILRPTFATTSTGSFTALVIDPSAALVTVQSLQAKLDEIQPLILAGL